MSAIKVLFADERILSSVIIHVLYSGWEVFDHGANRIGMNAARAGLATLSAYHT